MYGNALNVPTYNNAVAMGQVEQAVQEMPKAGLAERQLEAAIDRVETAVNRLCNQLSTAQRPSQPRPVSDQKEPTVTCSPLTSALLEKTLRLSRLSEMIDEHRERLEI